MDNLFEAIDEDLKSRVTNTIGVIAVTAALGFLILKFGDAGHRQRFSEFLDNLKIRNKILIEKLKAKRLGFSETEKEL